MTTTLQAPPRTPPPPPAAGPPAGPRSRRWLFGFWAATLIAFLAAAPGRMTFETKLGVALDPFRFLSDLGELWHSRAGFGGIFDQYVGYAFPMLPFYALADLAHLPVWLAERLWLSIVVTTAFWGALRLAERLGAGSPATRLAGAAAYALWPTFTIVVGSTSAAALPGALLPWVLLPLTDPRTTARVAALRSALVIPCMGGVNAASTLAALLPVALYLLSRPPTPRRRALIAWWVPGVLLATAWWVVPLLLLGIHGENFLPYVEQAETTTATMSATELLRGAGNWTAYLHFGEAWLPAGWTVATSVPVILGSALAAALGLAGLARRDMPERRWLLLVTLSVTAVTLAGYGGSLGGPFHGTVQDWLNGPLVPFRNIYKFQPGLALVLVLGLTHITATTRPRVRRAVPLLTTLLVLPALALPYLNGDILQPGSFTKLPAHWKATAGWLKQYSPDSRALVVPATAHGTYTWGSTIDQPLDVLAETRWAQRDYVPFGTPGNRRAMDAVEQALTTGAQVPGLSDYLGRAGLHYVVVRNDLDPDQLGYLPPQTVKRTLEESGYRRVTGFGPVLTGGRIPDDTPVQIEGLYPRLQAVEIYEPPAAAKRPGRADISPVADTAIVSGGPEALLRLSADPTVRRRPAVLTGDSHPGLGDPALRASADGLRRADTRFGLVNSNTSYTYTATEKNHPESLQDPGREPRQILPTHGTEHQTTAVLRGAESVTASSSGNWLFHLPQYDPVNAFDGNPDTAWAEGSAAQPTGEWLRIAFASPTDVPSQIRVTPLPSDGVRAAPTAVRVETDNGTRTSPLHPDGSAQQISAPPGKATYLKLTITSAQQGRPGLMGAGFTAVDIPGVQVTRLLSLPQDADPDLISLHRGSDPGGLSPVSAEVGLHRQFSTATKGTYALRATALPVPGDKLDELLYSLAPEQRRRLTATADSTSRLGASLTPRNLVDGDLTTAWIAGADPTLHLRWPEKRPIGEIVFAPAGGLSTRPEQVEISSPDGATTASVDENGLARFEPINTDRLDIRITRSAPLTVHNPVADGEMQLPVGLSEVYVPALEDFRVPQPDPSRTFRLPCGQGPVLAIDGTLHATSAEGKLSDLTERRPVEVSLCAGPQRDGRASLSAGTHRVEAGDQGPLALTDITLTRNKAAPPAKQSRELTVQDAAGDRRSLKVGPGEASYLQTYENANAGWQATLNGRKLPSVRLDGWQQGWLIPEGAGGTVRMEYAPARVYEAGLIGGALALTTLVALALYRRRTPAPSPDTPLTEPAAPAPGAILGLAAPALVLTVVAGPLVLLVPLLALVAHFRPKILPPSALLAMTAAGVAAALDAGAPASASEGTFGPAAQLLALTALTAALVTTARARNVRGAAPEPPPPATPATGTPGQEPGPGEEKAK
ncbi:coagulation factor 5/8 type domain-containing protein [Streptomyces agglomeratus]|uniref:alpha-(1->3)-arabinofuranosyltransferase domain-containing protein n=1 Tax=Streptomyces agglomeratus TaxID=285458 RepID=UPI000854F8A5|nr:alpha-(1->3)-arabinofuranosyltransferase family protein [Streptomyces agglomeratus]OEJ41684.1 coagulation factor 5/8 type domain-containing protein [Streptomyces agglomeratus]OEJ43938.1 coagulation factor 5/8 type domain-containing protein [Streptomyces agglomeratus]